MTDTLPYIFEEVSDVDASGTVIRTRKLTVQGATLAECKEVRDLICQEGR